SIRFSYRTLLPTRSTLFPYTTLFRSKTLKDLEGKVDEAEVKSAEEAKDALKAAIEKNDLDEIKAKKDALQEIVQNLSMKLYEEAAKQAEAAQGEEGKADTDDNVVDAEYEEVKDEEYKKYFLLVKSQSLTERRLLLFM